MDYVLLKKVCKKILARQVKFDMEDWYTRPLRKMETKEDAACGTTACIAGHVVITAGLAEFSYNQVRGWEYQLKQDMGFYDWEGAALQALNPQYLKADDDNDGEGHNEWSDLHSLFRLKNTSVDVALKLIVNDGATVRDAVAAAWAYEDSLEAA